MKKDNRIIVDLKKVQWAKFGYRNQYGDWRNVKPTEITYLCQEIDDTSLMFNPNDNHITKSIDWLTAHNLCDVWQPELYLKLQANESLVYTGEKAKSIWKEWNRRIYGK